VVPNDLSEASREELIDLVITSHHDAERERAQRLELEQQLRWFKKQLFGAKSERRLSVEDEASQLCLGEESASKPEVAEAPTTVRAHARKRRPRREEAEESGLRFDDSVPVETIVVEDPALVGLGANETVEITEKVSYRLAQEPAAYKVLRIVRRVVKRRDTGELSCPPAPPAVLPKSYADVSLLAGMLVDKFRYHLPLYRQHQRMQAAGITVSRSSLSNWVHQAVELLEPIYRAQLASILGGAVVAMDETPIRAGRKAKGKMRTAYFWPLYGERDEVAFPYAPSRAHGHAKEILGEYCGTLLSDGYEAYDRFAARRDQVVHALCWAHARRGFVKGQDVEPERCEKALELISSLYETEAEIRKKGLEGEAKARVRGEQSRPVVQAFFAWLEEELVASALLPSNPFTQAAVYARERRAGLEVFLADPNVPIDTNHLERALRPIPMGRKNWLFCWTEVGAEKVGQTQSLLATCVLHDVDPYTYLVDILQRVDTHPFSRVDELTPRRWKELFAADPLRSLLHRHNG
jgi:transposase